MIGPNGAGKSTVFNLIAGTIAPDGGTIRFDGHELSGLGTHLRARLGIVRAFQIPQPFAHLTVYENVLAAASFGGGLSGSQAQTSTLDVLAVMGLRGKAEMLAGQLPLLDRKRLELGKAVASRAKLLLLDEIAAGLTEPEVEDLVALIARLKQRHAIIWIEHIPHALRAVADRIMVLHFGRNVLEGPPAEVMKSGLVREIYMGFRADDAP
jgi:branched-chain amino acid transport system ATP-binding protein